MRHIIFGTCFQYGQARGDMIWPPDPRLAKQDAPNHKSSLAHRKVRETCQTTIQPQNAMGSCVSPSVSVEKKSSSTFKTN